MWWILTASLLAQPETCDRKCLERWFDQQYRHLDLVPPEVVAEVVVRDARASADSLRVQYMLERVGELVGQVAEVCPVHNRLRLMDSVEGMTVRALQSYPSRLRLEMDRIQILGRVDRAAAIEAYSLYVPPQEVRGDEMCQAQRYFEVGLELGEPVRGVMLRRVKTQALLMDLHQALLTVKLRQPLERALLRDYREALGQMKLETVPEALTWMANVWFWAGMMRDEMAGEKTELLEAITALVKAMPRNGDGQRLYQIESPQGMLRPGAFWPQGAVKVWKASMGEEGAEVVKTLLEGQVGKGEVVEKVMLWGKPAGKELQEKLVELKKSYGELTKAGVWEARLGEVLELVRNYRPEAKTDEERVRTFFEKQLAWGMLLAFSDYQAPKAGEKVDLEAMRENATTRPPHFAKRMILRDVLGHLESEEGREIYRLRRALWIGQVRLVDEEIRTRQKELVEFWRETAGVTASEVIRAYSR